MENETNTTSPTQTSKNTKNKVNKDEIKEMLNSFFEEEKENQEKSKEFEENRFSLNSLNSIKTLESNNSDNTNRLPIINRKIKKTILDKESIRSCQGGCNAQACVNITNETEIEVEFVNYKMDSGFLIENGTIEKLITPLSRVTAGVFHKYHNTICGAVGAIKYKINNVYLIIYFCNPFAGSPRGNLLMSELSVDITPSLLQFLYKLASTSTCFCSYMGVDVTMNIDITRFSNRLPMFEVLIQPEKPKLA